MPLGGFNQNYSPPQQIREKIVEKKVVDEERLQQIHDEHDAKMTASLQLEVSALEEIHFFLRKQNNILDEIIMRGQDE